MSFSAAFLAFFFSFLDNEVGSLKEIAIGSAGVPDVEAVEAEVPDVKEIGSEVPGAEATGAFLEDEVPKVKVPNVCGPEFSILLNVMPAAELKVNPEVPKGFACLGAAGGAEDVTARVA